LLFTRKKLKNAENEKLLQERLQEKENKIEELNKTIKAKDE